MHSKFILPLLVSTTLTLPVLSSAIVIDRIAAIVNDQVIAHSEVIAMQQLGLHISGLPQAESPLHARIDHHLVLQQIAEQPPITLTEEMVQDTIASFSREHGGNEELLFFLNSIGLNYEDFEREIREQLSIREFITIRFRPFVSVTIEAAEEYYNTVYTQDLQKKGEPVPSLAQSFDQIQARLAETRMKEQTVDWLSETRKSASIYIKQ